MLGSLGRLPLVPQVRKTRGEILEALFTGLRRLEYRGYDSAGVSIDADPVEPEYENGHSLGNGQVAEPIPFVRIEATSPDSSPTARDLANSPGKSCQALGPKCKVQNSWLRCL